MYNYIYIHIYLLNGHERVSDPVPQGRHGFALKVNFPGCKLSFRSFFGTHLTQRPIRGMVITAQSNVWHRQVFQDLWISHFELCRHLKFTVRRHEFRKVFLPKGYPSGFHLVSRGMWVLVAETARITPKEAQKRKNPNWVRG
jgi:hypothetical protein